jgi:endonuclease/exonuclease/phosphatase family metal-dependent hydrolase
MTTVDYSLRIGTFNTQLTSWVFELSKVDWRNPADVSWFVPHLPELISDITDRRKARAAQIAERILNGGFEYDVIALNEVFHEDARDVLVSALSGTFPYHVEKSPVADSPLPGVLLDLLPGPAKDALEWITPGAVWDLEDSGLALFSRFPIESTQFHLFAVGASGFPDYMASKGALYARIANPRTGLAFHVVAAHTHEDKAEWADIRAAELEQMAALVNSRVSKVGLTLDNVIVLGDLNIAGNLKPSPWLVGEPPVPEPGSEYALRFGPDAPPNFFSVDVHDTWLRHQGAKDPGGTTMNVDAPGLAGNRLDLILHNENDRLLVPQHLTLAYNLCSAAGDRLSDHIGVNAEFNHAAPHATPRAPIVIGPKTTDKPVPGQIRFARAIEWIRVDRGGTYCFGARPTNPHLPAELMRIDIYAATDLSRSLTPYHDLERTFVEGHYTFKTHVYVLADPPYYLRVRSTDTDWTGPYAFFCHRNAGQSAEDAVVLDAWAKSDGTVMPTGPLNAEDAVWHRFDLEVADSGEPQHLVLTADGGALKLPWTVELRGADETSVLDNAVAVGGTARLEWAEPGPGARYALVARNDPSFTSVNCYAGWTTDLTILHGGVDAAGAPISEAAMMIVHCVDETDPEWGGADNIMVSITADGTSILSMAGVGRFDGGDYGPIESLMPPGGVRYLAETTFQLFEGDTGPDDPSPVQSLGPLEDVRACGELVGFDFEGGLYKLSVNRSHRMPPA